MRYSPQFLDEIRGRLPVSQVVGRKVALKRKGREFSGLSPFKTEKTPSFFVNDQKGFYHCFASGEHGDIFSFLMKSEGVSFTDAVERLAKEAGLEPPAAPPDRGRRQSLGPDNAPANWRRTTDFRLFVSHIAQHSEKATRLKDCLDHCAISAFVAHDDIRPTADWQGEIERALKTMDAFLAIHTEGFSKSVWTQQEIGYALGRGVKVISFKMGEDPTGFISKHQALARRGRTAEQVAAEVAQILADDPQTRESLELAKKARLRPTDDDDEIPF